ncbi:MAG TPA: metalloregulator ArsR/SmtB family transcription factor [Bacillota bacterium]|nr:metalloregulator ArsR/SmtB family transcription factor [Bacillota bacterium]
MKITASAICKVLSVETRLNIIKLLKTKGPLGAQDIAGNLGVSTAAISQHLKILSQVGIVTGERKGFCIPYTINEAVLRQYRQLLAEACLCGCPESNKPNLVDDLDSANLEELRNYEKELEQILKAVRERIKAMESK